MPLPAGRPRHLNSAAAAVEAPNLPPPPVPRLLLVTAHPDDEALFFAPALLGVGTGHGPLGRCTVVDVLCLSNGAREMLCPQAAAAAGGGWRSSRRAHSLSRTRTHHFPRRRGRPGRCACQ